VYLSGCSARVHYFTLTVGSDLQKCRVQGGKRVIAERMKSGIFSHIAVLEGVTRVNRQEVRRSSGTSLLSLHTVSNRQQG
jgi:hypothetical protein